MEPFASHMLKCQKKYYLTVNCYLTKFLTHVAIKATGPEPSLLYMSSLLSEAFDPQKIILKDCISFATLVSLLTSNVHVHF